MFAKMLRVLRNEEGIETLEWLAIAALVIILVAAVVYPGNLPDTLNNVINNISTHI
jgi:Flp pilus assembly pilin Flp